MNFVCTESVYARFNIHKKTYLHLTATRPNAYWRRVFFSLFYIIDSTNTLESVVCCDFILDFFQLSCFDEDLFFEDKLRRRFVGVLNFRNSDSE